MNRRRLAILGAAVSAALGLGLLTDGLWIKAKAVVAQVLLERAFTETVVTGKPVKPWSWADTWPVARISVPRLGESAIVLKSASGQAMAFGPGHLDRTAEPGGRGTAVFAAHRDTHFAFLGDVVPGDQIVVTRGDGLMLHLRSHRKRSGALRPFRNCRQCEWAMAGAHDLLAARWQVPRTNALCRPCADDRGTRNGGTVTRRRCRLP